MKLSIIIPVYNLDQFLKKCLDSVLFSNADPTQYEIVAVNDGSTDTSLTILNEYANRFSNLIVINQINQGVSAARNKGIKCSHGDYLTFLDGDDYIHGEALEKILNCINIFTDTDIIYAEKETIEKNILVSTFKLNTFEDTILYKTEELRPYWYINGGSMCGGFYRRHLFTQLGIEFNSLIKNGEDTLLCYRLLTYHLNIRFVRIPFYVINIRNGSASRSANIDKVLAFKNNIDYLVDTLINNTYFTKEQVGIMHQAAYHMFGNAVAMFSHTNSINVSSFISTIGIKRMLPLDIKFTDPRYRNKVRLLNNSPYLFTILGYIIHRHQRQI